MSDEKLKVMISAPYMLPIVDRFRPFFEKHGIELLIPPVTERLEEEDLLKYGPECHGAICGDDRYTEKVVAACPKLKVISKWGTGIDSIDKKACAAHNIVIGNTPNAFSDPVSDSCLGYILAFARQIPWTTEAMRIGRWEKLPGKSLNECTLGIIGVGDVGKAVARRTTGFRMKLIGYDIKQIDPDFLKEVNMQVASSKEELLKVADFVSINCDLNDTSFHLMDDAAFDLMQPHAVLINTARGPIVHEEALIRALQQNKIAGAAMDVFEDEPLPGDSPLRHMHNVLMAPHNSNSSPAAWERVHINTINNLIKVFQKEFPNRTFDFVSPEAYPPVKTETTKQFMNPKSVTSEQSNVVLITGVAGGIGLATAQNFANAGWFVVGVDRSPIQGGTPPFIQEFVQCDISKPEAINDMLEAVQKRTGTLHALVNNAAAQITKSLVNTTQEEWDMIMETNVRSVFLTAKAFHPLLKKTKGAVVNVSSVHAIGTSRDIAAYATSKGALLAMTRAMALDFGEDGIRVNAVLPGAVDTGMLRSGLNRSHVSGDLDVDAKVRALGKKHVMGRVGRPDEIGQAILFLADSTRSSFMTGQAMVVDGGATSRLSTE